MNLRDVIPTATMALGDRDQLQQYLDVIQTDLDSTMDFWLSHSHDDIYGGFFNCLDKDGNVFDETKYGWMQGRQVWMYSKLYNDVPRFHTEKIRAAIVRGADFLHHLKNNATSRCYFSVTRKGLPIKLRRTVFTECFYVMALSEASKALKDKALQEEAVEVMSKVIYWALEDPSELGNPQLAGRPPVRSLQLPLMLLCCVNQLVSVDEGLSETYASLVQSCIDDLLMHSTKRGLILENVAPDGSELPGTIGRLMNPGRAIECGWFLLDVAKKRKDNQLVENAINKFILSPLEYGWDKEHGGLFYQLDAEHKPLPLSEWNMKFWWPHTEAMVATLMAYDHTRDVQLLEVFDTVFSYAYSYFHDPSGEWFGYLNQHGEINQELKGGPFKGCFHVPRCLMMCEQILTRMLKE